MKKVEGHTHLYRNNAGVIINRDKDGLKAARMAQKKDELIETLFDRVDRLEKQLGLTNDR